jgi:hypothetical protein
MTQKELESLHTSCLDKKLKLNEDVYDKVIEEKGGKRFCSFWQDYFHEAMHPERKMIDYMKYYGFTVLDDPEYKDMEADAWVVFPPRGL